MSATTLPVPPAEPVDQRLVLRAMSWDTYVRTSDVLGEGRGLRLIYLDGRLTFSTKSRRRVWYADRLGELFKAVANACGVEWESAGETTFRSQTAEAGIEGDETFYVGPDAERMRGPQDVDLTVHPPPDLAIEVEVSHPADEAMATYGRLGVPEVWRYDAHAARVSFWLRQAGGPYAEADRSVALTRLQPADVHAQLQLAAELGVSRWFAQLESWARTAIAARVSPTR